MDTNMESSMPTDFHRPLHPGRIDVTAEPRELGLTLVRGIEPRPIVLTGEARTHEPGYLPGAVTLPHGLTPGAAAALSAALALVVAHYDVPLARSIANRIDAVLEADCEGRRIPVGMGLVRGWFEAPVGQRSTIRRRQ